MFALFVGIVVTAAATGYGCCSCSMVFAGAGGATVSDYFDIVCSCSLIRKAKPVSVAKWKYLYRNLIVYLHCYIHTNQNQHRKVGQTINNIAGGCCCNFEKSTSVEVLMAAEFATPELIPLQQLPVFRFGSKAVLWDGAANVVNCAAVNVPDTVSTAIGAYTIIIQWTSC